MYTLQSDRHGNLIICKGDTVRSGYAIIAYGSYNDLLAEKARIILSRNGNSIAITRTRF